MKLRNATHFGKCDCAPALVRRAWRRLSGKNETPECDAFRQARLRAGAHAPSLAALERQK
jgi:hypothetical protein